MTNRFRCGTPVLGLVLTLIAGVAPALAAPTPKTSGASHAKAFRTVTLETTEATMPGVAVAPDGRFQVVSILGHLFQIPAGGGAAKQLTFGFSYDSSPVVSPDGKRVAFMSDKDGSGGNVFVLDLATLRVTQLTHELQVGNPVWSPDGKTVAYLRHLSREEHPMQMIGFGGASLMELKTVPSGGGAPTLVTEARNYTALFYMPDGRLAWLMPEAGSSMWAPTRTYKLEAKGPDGTQTLATFKEDVQNAVLHPQGKGIYFSSGKHVKYLEFGAAKADELAQLTDGASQVAVTKDASAVFYADGGKFWRVPHPQGAPQSLPFNAKVTLEMRKVAPIKWTAPSFAPAAPRAILMPELSADGKRLIFMAAGFLYEQPLPGGKARRLFSGDAFERDPALSPDGHQLAYVVSEHGQRALRLHDFRTKATRTLYTVGGASWPVMPSWSADGTRVVFQRTDGLSTPYQLISIKVGDGTSEVLTKVSGSWTTRPHFSPDGRHLYYTARRDKNAAVYRLSLEPNAKPEAITALSRHVNDARVSPDGKWLAFRRNTEVWLAPMAQTPIKDEHLRRLTTDCSRSFAFTPDSSAVLFASGNRVWKQGVKGGAPVETKISLTLQRTPPAPVLVRRVRIPDMETGALGPEVSMLIQNGRIQWIGSETGKQLPAGVTTLDGEGRVATPGLTDAHVHAAWSNQQTNEDIFIAFGITSVRDVGASLDLLNAIRDRGDHTNLPVPRYFFSGEILEGAMPIWGDAFLQIATPEEARRTVRNYKAWGADFIKLYFSLPWHIQAAAADEAQRQGLPVAGHGLSFDELLRHVLQGYTSVEHTVAFMHADGRKLLAASGTRWCPTLTCEGGSELYMHEEGDRLKDPIVQTFVPPDKMKLALGGGRFGRAPREAQRANMQSSTARVGAAYREGAKLLAGTDALMTEVFFGLSLHWELEYLTQAGLTSLEALRIGTVEAAAGNGASRELGKLAPGRLADVVLLDGNPVENIRNAAKVWRVIKGGQTFDPKTLRPAASAN